MQDDTIQGGHDDNSRGDIFSSNYKPTTYKPEDKLLSRQVQARIIQQQSAEEYARKRLENAYSESRRQQKAEQLKSQAEFSKEYSFVEIPSTLNSLGRTNGDDQPTRNQPTEANPVQTNPTSAEAETQPEAEVIQNTNYQKRSSTSDFDAKRYHQAWQDYYKTYFGRYYQTYYQNYHQQLADHHQRLQAQMKLLEQKAKEGTATQEEIDEITRIKKEIIAGVKLKAKKVKNHNHFWPSVVATLVLVFLIFLQYNPIIVGAVKQYIKPGDDASIPTIVAPDSDSQISQEPTIDIPKIGVQAPVVYDIKGLYDSDVQPALEKGVVRYNFPGNVYPGQNGNMVLIGHSSNNVFNPGKYNYIFVNLNKLTVDDVVSLNYKGVRYTYKVTATEVVSPDNFKYIDDKTTDPVLTLMTCSPPGTNRSRLFIRAKQISPNPETNQDASEIDKLDGQQNQTNPQKQDILPGTAPSIWDRLNGIFN